MMTHQKRSFSSFSFPILFVSALGVSNSAFAVSLPDSGQVLNSMQQPNQPSPPSTPFDISQQSLEQSIQPGGATVTLKDIQFSGNHLYSDQELLAIIGDAVGSPLDLYALQRLALRITQFYRDQDYPFSMAYLPPQSLASGNLTIAIVEAQYGDIIFSGEEKLTQAMPKLLPYLKAGDPIKGNTLERAIGLVGDLPGISIDPVLAPGQAVGTSDLEIEVHEHEKYLSSIGVDNQGNRYTGTWRTRGNLAISGLATLGDQLEMALLLTEEELWYGNLRYSLPIMNTGARGYVGYTQTHYQLGEEFADLGATGKARISTIGAEYPFIRSQDTNLYIDLGLRHKLAQDRPSKLYSTNEKISNTLESSLRFDHKDTLLGGGLTWSSLSATFGDLDLDSTLAEADKTTAQTEGSFHKLTLDVARLQAIHNNWTFYGRINGQWTDNNLDSSEGMGLGGANGVRAYPEGEAFGDRGWLTQLELRYQHKQLQPYFFYDVGSIELNAKPWEQENNRRTLSGAGLGLRASIDGWNLDLASAWKIEGGSPQSDPKEKQPRIWASLQYHF